MAMTGRVVVITGATGGLGKVVAHAFAAEGASLALISSDQNKLDALAADLALPAERVLAYSADLRDAVAVQGAVEAVVDHFGAAHILLHLVGGWLGGTPLVEMAAEDLQSMLEQHVWTTFHLIQKFVPALVESGWGRVMVVSSPVAVRPPAKMGAYAIAKAAEEAMLLTLSEEVKAKGISATILQVRTIDVEHKREHAPTASNASWTTPEEIASAMLYLASKTADMVNGARLPLFGKGS